MLTLCEIKEKIYYLGNQIDVDRRSELYPMFSNSPEVFGDGMSIYIDDSKYHYIVMDRGQCSMHIESDNLDDVSYEVFISITATLAQKYELSHRERDKDFRRMLWGKQLELLGNINSEFVLKRKEEMDKFLEISPFQDDLIEE